MIRKVLPLGPTEYLLYKAILPSLEDIEALHNTQKEIQEGAKMERQRNAGRCPNERTEHNSRKITHQNGDKQSNRCKVQNTGFRMLNEFWGRVDKLSKNFSKDIRKIKMETKQKRYSKKLKIHEVK